jgi:protein TonB
MPIYLRAPSGVDWHRLLAFAAIAVLHVAALGSWFGARPMALPPPGQPMQAPMQVMFIAQAPVETPPVIDPRPRLPERKQPRLKQPKAIVTRQPAVLEIAAQESETPPDAAPQIEDAAPAPAAPAPAAVVPPNFVAAYLNNPGPHYPRASIRAREQGTVMLLVRVGADGRAGEVNVDVSSGYPRLDTAAVDVVLRRWRFVPARQGDRAVEAWVRVPITFELKQH